MEYCYKSDSVLPFLADAGGNGAQVRTGRSSSPPEGETYLSRPRATSLLGLSALLLFHPHLEDGFYFILDIDRRDVEVPCPGGVRRLRWRAS